jgi:hypothetical protein
VPRTSALDPALWPSCGHLRDNAGVIIVRSAVRPAVRLLFTTSLVVCAMTISARAHAQAVSGVGARDACISPNQAAIEQALGAKFKNAKVTTPARRGVSTCAWVPAARSKMSLTVTTYSQEAIKGTNQRNLRDYYESLKANHTQVAHKPAQVFPRVGRHASYFPGISAGSDAILVLRDDYIVIMGAGGINRDQALKLAEAAAR